MRTWKPIILFIGYTFIGLIAGYSFLGLTTLCFGAGLFISDIPSINFAPYLLGGSGLGGLFGGALSKKVERAIIGGIVGIIIGVSLAISMLRNS